MRKDSTNNQEYGLLPMPDSSHKVRQYKVKVKQALYVPTQKIAKLFKKSTFDSHIWVTSDIDLLLQAISHYGKIGPRKAEGKYKGLEGDPTRQQIILYTLVLDKDLEHILFYTRSSPQSVSSSQINLLGDKRLQGKGSIGFGGHIEHIDQFQWKVLALLIPGFYEQIRKTLSLEIARIREFEEELGINGTDLAHFFLATAFRQVYTKEELQEDIPVGAVHTCICAVAILDTQKLLAENRSLIFQKSEIASLEWIKVKELKKLLERFENDGGEIEEWSQILIHLFPDILQEAKRMVKNKR